MGLDSLIMRNLDLLGKMAWLSRKDWDTYPCRACDFRVQGFELLVKDGEVMQVI